MRAEDKYTTPEAATAALPAVEETVQAGRRTSLAAHSTSRELDDTGSGLAMEDPLYEAPESQMHSVHNPREGSFRLEQGSIGSSRVSCKLW